MSMAIGEGDEEEEGSAKPAKKEKVKLLEIPKDIKTQVGAAIRDFDMI